MAIKPLSLSKDLKTASADLDTARLISIINTNAVAIKVIVAGTPDSEVHMAAGERLSVEKDIGANVTVELATGGAVNGATVFGSQIAFTN
tara:strand:+ start:495 stop:764 length:270 start_codon:yes stop_codon:yes gene_type:complete